MPEGEATAIDKAISQFNRARWKVVVAILDEIEIEAAAEAEKLEMLKDAWAPRDLKERA